MAEKEVRDFYEAFPYPSKRIESAKHLYNNAAWLSSLVGRKPDGFRKGERILEAGCGTGEFSCGFALGRGDVLGIDISAASIEKARKLSSKFRLKNARFEQMDIMGNNLRKESFDYIFSMGVLHHNKKPGEAFSKLAQLLKPRGFIAVGLYNKYGRLPVRAKRLLLGVIAGNDVEKRVALANRLFCSNKPITAGRRIWLADKYAHPLESCVSFSEVMRWFRENNIRFRNSKPSIPAALANNPSFIHNMELLSVQLGWMLHGTSFFSVSGQKFKN